MNQRTVVKKEILQGTTPRIAFQIVDEDGAGFQPDALTMSVYDVTYTWPANSLITHVPPFSATPLADAIVNDRNDIDVLAECDAEGNVELHLEVEDTEITVPTGAIPSVAHRRILFRWEWGSPAKVGKHEVILTIAPDRETLAT